MPALVGDVGGTHARLALVDRGRLVHETRLRNDDHASFLGLLQGWLDQVGVRPVEAALAIAAPLEGDTVRFTNRDWTFSCAALTEALNVERLIVLNDFEAIAEGVPLLPPEAIVHIGGPHQGRPGSPRAVLGPGTGLGVAGLLPEGDGWRSLATEGGHVSLAAVGAEERALLDAISGGARLHAEAILSGPGLVRLHDAIRHRDGLPPRSVRPEDITAEVLSGDDAVADEVVERFLTVLGRFAGDTALAMGARGGVYLTGGILAELEGRLRTGAFRRAFDDKGSHAPYVRAIPTWQILEPHPALFGCAAVLGRTGVTR